MASKRITARHVNAVCLAVFLSGCAHHPFDCAAGIYHSDCVADTAGYRTSPAAWTNQAISISTANTQRAIDAAECQAYAMQAMPLPAQQALFPLPVAPRQYSVSGSVNGQHYMGTVTEEGSFADGVAAGQASVDNLIKQQREASQYAATARAQSQLSDACMYKRGWVKAPE
jgi:hypothetical protein